MTQGVRALPNYIMSTTRKGCGKGSSKSGPQNDTHGAELVNSDAFIWLK